MIEIVDFVAEEAPAGHVEYKISLQKGSFAWTVRRRYADFAEVWINLKLEDEVPAAESSASSSEQADLTSSRGRSGQKQTKNKGTTSEPEDGVPPSTQSSTATSDKEPVRFPGREPFWQKWLGTQNMRTRFFDERLLDLKRCCEFLLKKFPRDHSVQLLFHLGNFPRPAAPEAVRVRPTKVRGQVAIKVELEEPSSSSSSPSKTHSTTGGRPDTVIIEAYPSTGTGTAGGGSSSSSSKVVVQIDLTSTKVVGAAGDTTGGAGELQNEKTEDLPASSTTSLSALSPDDESFTQSDPTLASEFPSSSSSSSSTTARVVYAALSDLHTDVFYTVSVQTEVRILRLRSPIVAVSAFAPATLGDFTALPDGGAKSESKEDDEADTPLGTTNASELGNELSENMRRVAENIRSLETELEKDEHRSPENTKSTAANEKDTVTSSSSDGATMHQEPSSNYAGEELVPPDHETESQADSIATSEQNASDLVHDLLGASTSNYPTPDSDTVSQSQSVGALGAELHNSETTTGHQNENAQSSKSSRQKASASRRASRAVRRSEMERLRHRGSVALDYVQNVEVKKNQAIEKNPFRFTADGQIIQVEGTNSTGSTPAVAQNDIHPNSLLTGGAGGGEQFAVDHLSSLSNEPSRTGASSSVAGSATPGTATSSVVSRGGAAFNPSSALDHNNTGAAPKEPSSYSAKSTPVTLTGGAPLVPQFNDQTQPQSSDTDQSRRSTKENLDQTRRQESMRKIQDDLAQISAWICDNTTETEDEESFFDREEIPFVDAMLRSSDTLIDLLKRLKPGKISSNAHRLDRKKMAEVDLSFEGHARIKHQVLENISMFLHLCADEFQIKEESLFTPFDVLETRAKLQRNEIDLALEARLRAILRCFINLSRQTDGVLVPLTREYPKE
ncbi:unnamed protein product [Amoebophrya sp. A120]|nr:unnamed protein product [Amoebophrya sp. A120]|eukprot:GSA120T00011128001.1